jgi:hypothetical protein
VNVTLTAQFAPGARLEPQLFVSAKGALTMMLEIASGALPEFFSVTVCASPVAPTSTLPRFKLAGERPAEGAVPVPEREITCGLAGAVSEIDICPTLVPVVVGMKLTAMLQVAPPATDVPQLFDCA